MSRVLLLLALFAVPALAQDDLKTSADRGKILYATTCGICHQQTGMGLPGVFPPLGKVDYANGDARRAIAIVTKGVTGPITVNGTMFVGLMPPPDATFPALKDDKNLADVLNYVRTSFGNEVKEAITPAQVAEVRKEFADRTQSWTEAELKNFPAKK